MSARAVNLWCQGNNRVPQWAWIIAAIGDEVPLRLIEPRFAWHEVLAVKPGCSLQTARAARSRLAKMYHADKGGSHDAMVRINVAYESARRVLDA